MKSRKIKFIVIITLIVIIATLSIAYAVLSTTLTIVGTSEIKATAWDVYFSDVSIVEQKGNATVTMPTISKTTISNYSVGLQSPGDSVTFMIYIKNDSDLYAAVSSIINSTPICTSSTGNTADADLVCNNLIYEYKLQGNEMLDIGDTLTPTFAEDQYATICNKVNESGALPSILYLTIGFDSNATSVPSSNVTVSNLSNQIIFTQGEPCSGGSGSNDAGTSAKVSVVLTTNVIDQTTFLSEVYIQNAVYPIDIIYKLNDSDNITRKIISESEDIEKTKFEKTFSELEAGKTYTLEITVTDYEGNRGIRRQQIKLI